MRVLFAIVLASFAMTESVAGEPLTYDIGTINLHSPTTMSDYVVTGTITTNGTIGWLDTSDIISWSISVDGPLPHFFHPSNPGARVDPSDVYASTTTLTTNGQFGWLWFFAKENTLPRYFDCRQDLGFTSWIGAQISYNHYDTSDGDPPFAVATARYSDPPYIVATRIPEPASGATVIVGGAIVIGARSRGRVKVAAGSRGRS